MTVSELKEHRSYWDDGPKVEAYKAAFAKVITKDSVVLDLGSGTCLLGFLAAKAGAKRVYSVDGGSIIGLIEELIEANGLGDVIVPLHGFSTSVNLPEKVDVIVGDQIGGFAYDAGVNQYYADAVRRFGTPDVVTVPAEFELFAAPVTLPEVSENIEFWRSAPLGFDLSPAAQHGANLLHTVHLDDEALLGSGVAAGRVAASSDAPFDTAAEMTIEKAGELHAVVGYFRAQMASGVAMTNDPADPDRMLRRWQTSFPLSRSVAVDEGDQVQFSSRIAPTTYTATWKIAVTSAGGERLYSQTHSTFLGRFLSTDDVREVDAQRVEPTGERGRLERFVLDEHDRGGSIASISALAKEAFPDADPAKVTRAVTAAVQRARQANL